MTHSPANKLSRRHVEFLAIGGTVGAGLFVGSGVAIHAAGPSLIMAYGVAGAIVFVIARCLAEMSLQDPGRGNFVDYVRHYLGDRCAFVSGWSYWLALALAVMAELTAIGALSHAWAPVVPQWIPTFAAVVGLYAINRLEVRIFGEIEFWIALLKILALSAFIGCGIFILVLPLEIRPPTAAISNLWLHGGVFPTGLRGFIDALPVALFGFAGVELIGLAAAETRDPIQTLPRAVNGLLVRLSLFYVGSMIIIMSLLPWNEIAPGASPFVLVLQALGVPAVAPLMNVLLISVLLSSCNSCLFGAARVLHSLAAAESAPAAWGQLNSRGAPGRAAGVSMATISATILLNYFIPAQVFGLLLSSIVVAVAVNWVLFVLAHLRFRREHPTGRSRSPFRWPVPIWCNYGVIAFVGMILVVLACDSRFRPALAFSIVFFSALGFIARRRLRRSANFATAHV